MSTQDAEQLVGRNASAERPLTHVLSLDVAALLLRVGFGLTLSLAHGLKKLQNPTQFIATVSKDFPAPELLGWAAIFSEFAGGVFLALGLFTRSAATLVAGTLFVAAFQVHAHDPFAKKELALAYALVGLAIAIGGPGRYSIDAYLTSKKA
jgi:putative oxidoreductase